MFSFYLLPFVDKEHRVSLFELGALFTRNFSQLDTAHTPTAGMRPTPKKVIALALEHLSNNSEKVASGAIIIQHAR